MFLLYTAVYKQMLIFTYVVISPLSTMPGSSLDCHVLNLGIFDLEYCNYVVVFGIFILVAGDPCEIWHRLKFF